MEWRAIVSYDKKTGYFVKDMPIEIKLDAIKLLFQSRENDPLFYDPYEIDKQKSYSLQKYINYNFDFENFDYFLETFMNI
jgi:hypothetical protein